MSSLSLLLGSHQVRFLLLGIHHVRFLLLGIHKVRFLLLGHQVLYLLLELPREASTVPVKSFIC